VVRQGRLIALVGTFLIGCAFLLLAVGCSGTRSEAPKEEKQQGHPEATNTEQGHTEAVNKDQTRSPQATASEEEARCQGTRTHHLYFVAYRNGQISKVRSGSEEDVKKAGKTYDLGIYTTNDLPGCANGGLLIGTDEPDKLDGGDGDDEVRGLGDKDLIYGGDGKDVNYAGPGDDSFTEADGKGDDVIYGGGGDDEIDGADGEDVLYGGDGSDILIGYEFLQSDVDRHQDKLYCGRGKDHYLADKHDYVDSSCEKKWPRGAGA
jgi:hypothetical protein